MREVFFEPTASEDVLVDKNGDPLKIACNCGATGWTSNIIDMCSNPDWSYVSAGGGPPTVSFNTTPCRIDIDPPIVGGYPQDNVVMFDAVGELTGDFRVFGKNVGSTAPTGWHVCVQAAGYTTPHTARIGSYEAFSGPGAPHARIDKPGGNTDLGSGPAPRGWYEVSRFGNVYVFAAYGTTDPRGGGVIPTFSATRTLVDSEIAEFGPGRPVRPGLMSEASVSVASTSWSDFTVMTFG